MSVLKPNESLMAGLAVMAVVYSVFSNNTPTIADIRAADPNDLDVAKSEKQATWTAAGIVGAISLVAKDPTIFTMGGASIVVLAWAHRHANMVDPVSGMAVNTLDASAGMADPDDYADSAA